MSSPNSSPEEAHEVDEEESAGVSVCVGGGGADRSGDRTGETGEEEGGGGWCKAECRCPKDQVHI